MLGYNELLNDTCSYERYSLTNKYNEKVYESPVQVKCFVSYELSNNMGYDEQNVFNNRTIFIDNSFTPNIFDKINGSNIKEIKEVKGLKVPVIGWEIRL